MRRAFLFTNVTDGAGRKSRHAGCGRRLAASPRIYSVGMGRPAANRGGVVERHRQSGSAGAGRQAAVPGGRHHGRCAAPAAGDLRRCRCRSRRLASMPRPYSHRDLAVTRDPESASGTMGTYRAGLKATDRLGRAWRRASGGAGGFQHWLQHNKRKTPMPCAFVIGAAPVVMFTGPMKLPPRPRRDRVAAGLRARHSVSQMRHGRSRRAGRFRNRHRRSDRSRTARTGRPIRRKPRLHRARGLQHVDAGDRHHPQAQAGVRLDPQRGHAVGIERGQEGRL